MAVHGLPIYPEKILVNVDIHICLLIAYKTWIDPYGSKLGWWVLFERDVIDGNRLKKTENIQHTIHGDLLLTVSIICHIA